MSLVKMFDWVFDWAFDNPIKFICIAVTIQVSAAFIIAMYV